MRTEDRQADTSQVHLERRVEPRAPRGHELAEEGTEDPGDTQVCREDSGCPLGPRPGSVHREWERGAHGSRPSQVASPAFALRCRGPREGGAGRQGRPALRRPPLGPGLWTAAQPLQRSVWWLASRRPRA